VAERAAEGQPSAAPGGLDAEVEDDAEHGELVSEAMELFGADRRHYSLLCGVTR
jgi:hypothetical protein